MEVRHVHFNLGQCHRQFGQREKPKHVSAPCPQNYKRRPRNWTPLGRIGEPRKSIRGKEMNITDPIHAAISVSVAGPSTHQEAQQKALKLLQVFLSDACEAAKKYQFSN